MHNYLRQRSLVFKHGKTSQIHFCEKRKAKTNKQTKNFLEEVESRVGSFIFKTNSGVLGDLLMKKVRLC